MNSREITLITTATVVSAVASAIVLRFFANPRKKLTAVDSASNGVPERESSPVDPFNPSKRSGYLSWDDYFMALAFLSAERSKDPNRQVGACLVSEDGIILGIGYNGFPRGCSDDKLPWSKKSKVGDPLETKYPYVCHAEVNAILNTNHASAAGQKLYVTMFPCNECAKIIIQSGVSEVVYFVEKRLENADIAYVASHKLLAMAGVKALDNLVKMVSWSYQLDNMATLFMSGERTETGQETSTKDGSDSTQICVNLEAHSHMQQKCCKVIN